MGNIVVEDLLWYDQQPWIGAQCRLCIGPDDCFFRGGWIWCVDYVVQKGCYVTASRDHSSDGKLFRMSKVEANLECPSTILRWDSNKGREIELDFTVQRKNYSLMFIIYRTNFSIFYCLFRIQMKSKTLFTVYYENRIPIYVTWQVIITCENIIIGRNWLINDQWLVG